MTLGIFQPTPAPSNVVALNARQHHQAPQDRLARHADVFAMCRRTQNDVFWLKENAEFLNILQATDSGSACEDVCEVYADFYDRIDVRLGAYPQYYRFLLSICLDLEDLGIKGQKGAVLCDWARSQHLPEAELSDLQRGEARRLLARRGKAEPDPALVMRLHRFINRTATFAVPNRKAAYELTHIVFYLSQYGRCDPGLSPDALQSLTFCGLLAYLDQNYDLLAEVCIAMRYAGQRPSTIWEGAVTSALKTLTVTPIDAQGGLAMPGDSYHEYFVSTWLGALAGLPVMPADLPDGGAWLDIPTPKSRPLQHMSEALEDLSQDDWDVAKRHLATQLDEEHLRVVEAAETSTEQFGMFYQLFARAARPSLVST